MQKIYLCILIFPLLLSCSQDAIEQSTENPIVKINKYTFSKMTGYPQNNDNIYDVSGQLYYQIMDIHLNNFHTAVSVPEIITNVDQISHAEPDFASLAPIDYVLPDGNYLIYLCDNPLTASQVMDSTLMSSDARTHLANFIDGLLVIKSQQKDYGDFYTYIRNFESMVIADHAISAEDKRVMLVTSSISRYAFFFASTHKKRKPRDKDWNINATGLLAGTMGSFESTAKAITMSACMGLAFNRDY